MSSAWCQSFIGKSAPPSQLSGLVHVQLSVCCDVREKLSDCALEMQNQLPQRYLP